MTECKHEHKSFYAWEGPVEHGTKEDGLLGVNYRPATYQCERCGKLFYRIMIRV